MEQPNWQVPLDLGNVAFLGLHTLWVALSDTAACVSSTLLWGALMNLLVH